MKTGVAVLTSFLALAGIAIAQPTPPGPASSRLPAANTMTALTKVKALYAEAAYEDALAVLAAVPTETPVPELDQYRAFCLIALGDQPKAEVAIENLLVQNPLYQPDGADTSPRVIEVFREVRSRVMPAVSKRLYVEAKSALERREREQAVKGFETLLQLIGSEPANDETLDDLKVLAQGFLDLSRSLPAATPAPASTPASVDTAPPANTATGDAPTASSSVPVTATANWVRPVAVRQQMPPWNAPDSITRNAEFRGVLRVNVGADGKVVSSEIVRSAHPLYDRLLLNASKDWLYQPARQDGKPITAEVLVEVLLRPED
jgi:outer membrane biosynthesis protein TonB